MDLLDKKNRYNSLFDYYGSLLTNKQQDYFKAYYFEDLSLSEIAAMNNVSRNAVFDQLNKIYNILDLYEEKLHLWNKEQKYEQIYAEYSQTQNDEIKILIEKLRSLN